MFGIIDVIIYFNYLTIFIQWNQDTMTVFPYMINPIYNVKGKFCPGQGPFSYSSICLGK
jgi:hypothetical protein